MSKRILFHGTSTEHLPFILEKGLMSPFLTNEEELASYYAQEAVDEVGGNPLVLVVEVDESLLRFDGNAMDEPVSYFPYSISDLEKRVQTQRIQLMRTQPDWVDNGYLCIPQEAYQISLQTVASCYYEGIIHNEYILDEREEE